LMQRVCNAPLKELPATLPSTHLTHANSLHTATAVPHIPRQSQTAQAGVAPTHYLFFLLTWPLFFSLGRGLTACASALGAHFRLRQLGRGRGALWRLGGRHLHLVGRGVRVRVRARADGVGVLAAAASRRAPMPRHALAVRRAGAQRIERGSGGNGRSVRSSQGVGSGPRKGYS